VVEAACPNKPDLKKALDLKEEGNRLFKENKMKEAREAYTKSLQLFPVDYDKPLENKDYAIILANRTATLDVSGKPPYINSNKDHFLLSRLNNTKL
jgi:hypothetical protein